MDDEDEEGYSDVGDDEDDDECPGDVSFNMTGKEDPDFSPGIDALKKEAAALPTRRSSRLVIPFLLTINLLLTAPPPPPPSSNKPPPSNKPFQGKKVNKPPSLLNTLPSPDYSSLIN